MFVLFKVSLQPPLESQRLRAIGHQCLVSLTFISAHQKEVGKQIPPFFTPCRPDLGVGNKQSLILKAGLHSLPVEERLEEPV